MSHSHSELDLSIPVFRPAGYVEHPLRFTFTGRIKSLMYALRGISLMIASQHNAWIHLLITALVFVAGAYFRITRFEWAVIVLSIVTVWAAESLNTAFEFLADVASPEFHPLVEKAKDVAAGAVLIAAIGALIVGIMIFGPYLIRL